MPFMTWNDKLSVGVDKIDYDHKRMVCLINELFDGILAGHSEEMLANILNELVAYTQYHFAREEGYFAQTLYVDAATHKLEHHDMVLWISDIQTRYREGTLAAPSLEVINYLKDWLFDHIIQKDQQLGRHLNELGIH